MLAAEPEDMPQMAGGAVAVARRSRRLPPCASAPALSGVTSPGKPPTPPTAFGERPRRRSFGTSEANLAAEEKSPSHRASPNLASTRQSPTHSSSPNLAAVRKSPSHSPESQNSTPNSTPRTPRSVEVRVEGQELAVPGGAWASDGHLELAVSENICTVTVKTGLSGRSGLNVVLRVGLAIQGVPNNCLRLPPTAEALSAWTKVQVAGVEECDMGRLPSRSGSLPKAPQPGLCQHEWSDAATVSGRCDEVSAQEAVILGPSAVSCAEFCCGLSLEVAATCSVTAQGQAKMRVEVRGELRILPRFSPAGCEGVARLYKAARLSYSAGDDLDALQKCQDAVIMADALVPRPRELGDVLNLMGAVHLRRQNPKVAVKCLEGALVVRERLAGGQADLGMASTLSTLGNAHQALGAHADAIRCHERACSILKAVSGSSDPAVASCLQSLGGLHRASGSLGDSRKCFEEALSIREQVLGADDLLTASTLNNLGAVLQGLSDSRGAIQCYHKSLAIQMRVHGRSHPSVAATLSNLGSAHSHLEEHQWAVDCHNRALGIQESHLDPEDPGVATSLHNLGNALAQAGKGGDAARCLWRALAIWSKLGTAQRDVAATLHSLGNVYRALGDSDAAARCFAGALRIREALLGPAHKETARTRHCAALVGCALGEKSTALHELEVAAASLLSSLGAKHPWSMQARADAESLRQVVAS